MDEFQLVGHRSPDDRRVAVGQFYDGRETRRRRRARVVCSTYVRVSSKSPAPAAESSVAPFYRPTGRRRTEPFVGAPRLMGEGGAVDHVDADAFAAFYTEAQPDLNRAVQVTLGDSQLAHDAVNEAFTRAAERWSQVRDLRNPAGWVYRVAVNWATSWRRKLALRPTRSAEHLDRAHRDTVPDLDLEDALAVLPLTQRQMLVLRYAFGCSVTEVADALGVAEGTVKSGVHRARQRLRDDGRWQDRPDDAVGPAGRQVTAENVTQENEVFDGRP